MRRDKVEVNKEINDSALTNVCHSGNTEVLKMLLSHPNIDVNQKTTMSPFQLLRRQTSRLSLIMFKLLQEIP